MTFLIFAQTLFYLTVSLAIIALGIFFGMITYYLMKVVRELSRIANNVGEASDDLRVQLEDVLEQLASIPFLSSFLRPNSRRYHKKGRE